MVKASREFQVFVKPISSICNLDCNYCYYLKKKNLYPKDESCEQGALVLKQLGNWGRRNRRNGVAVGYAEKGGEIPMNGAGDLSARRSG